MFATGASVKAAKAIWLHDILKMNSTAVTIGAKQWWLQRMISVSYIIIRRKEQNVMKFLFSNNTTMRGPKENSANVCFSQNVVVLTTVIFFECSKLFTTCFSTYIYNNCAEVHSKTMKRRKRFGRISGPGKIVFWSKCKHCNIRARNHFQ